MDFNNTGKGLTDRLARPVNIFRTFHTLTGGYFLTLSMFWGHTVGHLSHEDLLIITASELCVERQMHKPLSMIFSVHLYTHRDTSMSLYHVSLIHHQLI